MNDLVFFPVAAVMLAGAFGVVLAKSLYRAAYCLAATLVATAVLYLALTSPLIAAVQILLYTGGVLTLVVFALVLTRASAPEARYRRPLPALILAALVFAALAVPLGALEPSPLRGGLENGTSIGRLVFTTYLVPFELLSLLLLAAIFGALVVARKEGSA